MPNFSLTYNTLIAQNFLQDHMLQAPSQEHKKSSTRGKSLYMHSSSL